VTLELNDLCLKAANAVGSGVLAVDLMETPDGLVVNEINYTVEFRNSIQPTNVNIPAKIIDYAIGIAGE
jgi:[lysine-biosynthesis-protein LysW]--L-2-aminoadipate ligase